MTVDNMLTSMTLNELNHWIAFHKIEQENYEKEKLELDKNRTSKNNTLVSKDKDVAEMSEDEVKAMFGI